MEQTGVDHELHDFSVPHATIYALNYYYIAPIHLPPHVSSSLSLTSPPQRNNSQIILGYFVVDLRNTKIAVSRYECGISETVLGMTGKKWIFFICVLFFCRNTM